ncbi:hypothetical protein ABZ114_02975 [Streptomyces albidoflavus]|uniref:hypothetical protein n=1 Tax=Streptomyces albidoflavus TaxID=1886 RepID=UPI0033AA1FE8
MTPKFRLHDRVVRDDRRKSRAETLHRKTIRTVKYEFEHHPAAARTLGANR